MLVNITADQLHYVSGGQTQVTHDDISHNLSEQEQAERQTYLAEAAIISKQVAMVQTVVSCGFIGSLLARISLNPYVPNKTPFIFFAGVLAAGAGAVIRTLQNQVLYR